MTNSMPFLFEIAVSLLFMTVFFGWLVIKPARSMGLALAWCNLFGLAGSFRLLLAFVPSQAAGLAWCLLVSNGLAIVYFLITSNRARRRPSLQWRDTPWLLLLGFLFVRSFFPQFDVDSLLYHINAIRFLSIQASLPEYQQHLEVGSLWYGWVGFEESLLVPALPLDMGLAAGLLGGTLKIFSCLSVILLIPRQAFLLRTIAAFLLLIDDHFFFSGASRFVYLNPSLIGLVAVATWLAFRAIREPQRYAVPAIAIGTLAATAKMHGLFFLLGIVLFVSVTLMRKKQWPKFFVFGPASVSFWLFFASGISAFFLLRWLQTGSPLAPFDLLFLKADHSWRDALTLHGLQRKSTSLVNFLRSPWRALVYPGNLAMKASAVLLFPALIFNFFRRERGLQYAAYCLLITWGWALVSRGLNPEDSRYPRYVFGIAILGLCHLVPPCLRVFEKNVFSITGRLKEYAAMAAAMLLCFILIKTIDTRYYNVPSGERPSWTHWRNFVADFGRHNSLAPEAPHMRGLYMPYVYEDVIPLKTCIDTLAERTEIKQGAGLILFSPFSTWPMFLLSPGAVAGSEWEGGGPLKGIDSVQTLRSRGIRFALIPRLPNNVVAVQNTSGQNYIIHFVGKPLCESPNMQLLALEP